MEPHVTSWRKSRKLRLPAGVVPITHSLSRKTRDEPWQFHWAFRRSYGEFC